MSATADKARYFLERSVPELKELEQKKIFTPEEITSISRKRSDFEHKINARGSSPRDYAQYAEFEMNVDLLRKRRVARLGVKSTAFNGQTRIFFVFDRGTRKFPGDVKLWLQAINYAMAQRANKKVTQLFTNVLRLHPTNSDLWIMAATFAIERNGSMNEARGYAQRGLRFCKRSQFMWLQYFKLELIHGAVGDGKPVKNSRKRKAGVDDILPGDVMGDEVDQHALAVLDTTASTAGAVPIAVFDAAMQQFETNPALALQFFDIAFEFDAIIAYQTVIDHIHQHIQQSSPRTWQAQACDIAHTMYGLSIDFDEYPSAFRNMLAKMNQVLKGQQRPSADAPNELWFWCDKFLVKLWREDMDEALKTILQSYLSALSTREQWP